jgi:glucokinase
MSYLIGIDIGGTKCAVVLGMVADEQLHLIGKETFQTEIPSGYEAILKKIGDRIDVLLKQYFLQPMQIAAIGISCGGPLDSKKGIIMSPPNLPGWDQVPIVDIFHSRYDVPVAIQNDANACALAEWQYGAGKGYNNLVFLTFGTGLGAGLILNGKLYTGANDMAGEVGHIRLDNYGPVGYGKTGSFEGFCSGSGIAQLARIKIMEQWQKGKTVSFCSNRNELDGLSAAHVADAAKHGDPLAREIYEISGAYLGRGLSVLIDILNPEAIIIGSIFTRHRELLWDNCHKVIEQEALSHAAKACQILTAALGDEIGNFASLSVAADYLKALQSN